MNLESIARRFEINLVDMAKDPGNTSPEDIEAFYINRSNAGCYEIILGIYQDPDLRLVSFFHELGHLIAPPLGPDPELYDREFQAWRVGLMFALVEGYRAPPAALEWADLQLESYVGWEAREVRGYKPPALPQHRSARAVRDFAATLY